MVKERLARGGKFSDEEVALIDAILRDFALRYETERESDIIPLQNSVRAKMPFTKISIEQNRQLDLILEWRLGDRYDQVINDF